MIKSRNYYERFRKFLDDVSDDDLLKTTEGYQQSVDSITEVNEWAMKNAKADADFKEFEEIFSDCLIADETLWFNLSWEIGWAAGVCQCLKTLGPDIDGSISNLADVIYSLRAVT